MSYTPAPTRESSSDSTVVEAAAVQQPTVAQPAPEQSALQATAQPVVQPPSQLRRLDRYDGKFDYNLYRAQFLNHANCLKWSEATKGVQLSQSLTKDALQVLTYLSPQLMTDFATLDEALRRRFGVTINVREHKARLRSLRRAQDTTLAAYSTAVEDAVRGAYPGRAEETLQLEMVDAFVHGINNETLSMMLVKDSHTTLHEALTAAELLCPPQAQDGSERKARARQVEAGTGSDLAYQMDGWEAPGPAPPEIVPIMNLESAVESLTISAKASNERANAMVNSLNTVSENVQKLANEQKQLLESRKRERSRSSDRSRSRDRTHRRSYDSRGNFKDWLAKVICHRCGRKGHTKRYCRTPEHKLPVKKEASREEARANVAATAPPFQPYCVSMPVYLPLPGMQATAPVQPSSALTAPGRQATSSAPVTNRQFRRDPGDSTKNC